MNRVPSKRRRGPAQSTFVPLRLQQSRRSKGQRYYPRPPKNPDPLNLCGRGVERPSCAVVRLTQPGRVL